MVKFERFMAIYLLIVVALAVFLVVGVPLLQSENERRTVGSEENHFSVVYRGFIPDYDATYPDYYITINDLAVASMQMNIRLFIQNQESSGYYFKVEQSQVPPAGWTISPYLVGQIPVDGTKDIVYSQIWRTTPTSIPAGELTETIYIAVKAYHDSGYTNLYSQDSFNATYHFIDRTSATWSTLYQDNFDDGTVQGWSGYYYFGVSTTYYRSFRYSLYAGTYSPTPYMSKTFIVPPQYSEAYVVFAMRNDNWANDYPVIYLDGTIYFRPDKTPTSNIWYQFTVPLHTGSTTLRIDVPSGTGYLDDVYVVAK